MKRLFGKFKHGWMRIKKTMVSDSILVYQMGKVGSSTLEASIPGAAHLHTLYAAPPCKELLRLERQGLMRILGFLYDAFRVLVIKTRKEVKIITLIREPVSRNVSMFFQDFPYWYIKYQRENRGITRESKSSLILDIYREAFPHEYVDDWFDKELKRLTGIDVYSFSYDKAQGYQLYSKGKYKVLLLEMNAIERNWGVLESFVGRDLEIKSVNRGDDKWYAAIYREYKQSLLDDCSINKKVKSGKFYKKFYAD